jgi:hypothetical protein
MAWLLRALLSQCQTSGPSRRERYGSLVASRCPLEKTPAVASKIQGPLAAAA